ncbi:hypothetical protein [Pseudomonas yamanorum]
MHTAHNFRGNALSLDLANSINNQPVVVNRSPNTDRGLQIDSLQKGVYFQDQIKFDEATTSRAGLVYKADNGLAPYLSYSESFFPVAGVSKAGQVFVPTEGKQYEFGDLPLVGQQRRSQRFGASGIWRWGR